MTRFLQSDDNPGGYRLEDILDALRADVIGRCGKITSDQRAEAQHVLANNMRILELMTRCIEMARDSTRVLDRSLGPSKAAKGGAPRIGSA